MGWTQIPASETAVDKPVTASLMTNIVNNIKEASPTGVVIDWPLATPPSGFLMCDGSAISRTTYAALFAVIGTTYGAGDGSSTFNLPDRRGEFVRGWDNGAARDPDRASRTDRGDGTTGDAVGTKQNDQYRSHTHAGARRSSYTSQSISGYTEYNATSATSTGSSGGNETRPRNIYTNYCIRYTGD